MPDATPAAPQHEFAAATSPAFADLGAWMLRAAALLAVLSALFLGLSFLAFHSLLLAGPDGARFGILGLAGCEVTMVGWVTAWWLRRAARSMRSVAETTGSDVTHVTAALKTLDRAFRVLLAAGVALVALVVLALVAHHGR